MNAVDAQSPDAPPRRFARKRIWLCSITAIGFAAVVLAFAVYSKATHPRVPAIDISTATLQLGEGFPGAELTGTFEIINRGQETLTFQLRASCGCTQLTPREGEVGPGDSQQVVVALRLPAVLGTNKKAAVFINSNDPRHPTINCEIEANCPFPFGVTPARVQLNAESGETHFVQRLTIEEAGQVQFRNLADLKIVCPPEHCRVTEVSRSGSQVLIDLAIDILPDQRDTKFFVSLNHAADSRQMHIPVQILHSDSIIAIPGKQIVHFESSEQTKDVHAWIIARNGKELRDVKLIDLPAGIDATQTSIAKNKIGYRITVHKAAAAVNSFTLKYQCDSSEGKRVLSQDFEIRGS